MAEREMPRAMKTIMSSPVWKAFQHANTWIYRRTGGKMGGSMGRAPIALVTTTGRKTGKPRTVPLLYLKDGEDLVLVASKGGWPEHPLWYRNLCANPQVEVQVGGEHKHMAARTANSEERARLWPKLVAMYSDYGRYQSWTDREIPVVILSQREPH